MGNSSLTRAKKAREDDFFTQLTDIEKELVYYKSQFKGKTIFCNCDDPEYSNFWKYFYMNFHHLGIKRLISTHYDYEETTYKLEYDGKTIVRTDLKENGDFRSNESLKVLEIPDLVVVTNPPFSLLNSFLNLIISKNKEFLIIGNQNAITYKDIFPLFRENKVWLGYYSGDMEFRVPDSYEPRKTRYREDEEGRKWRSLGNICWFTNLDVSKRHEKLILYKTYTEEEYPKYDNYDAINVGKVAEIPQNYDGAMGVPITFLSKYNPEQFEILDANEYRTNGNTPFKEHGLIKDKDGTINGKATYVRILIKRRGV